MDDIRLGTLLLENNIIQEMELERCLEIQALTGGSRPLGQILIEQGTLSAKTLEELLELQAKRTEVQRKSLPLVSDGDDRFLRTAVQSGASELIISEGRPVMARVAGDLVSLTEESLTAPEVWQFVRQEMGHEVLEEIAEKKAVTRGFWRDDLCRGRISAFRHFDGIAVVVRLHPAKTRTLEEAAIPPDLAKTLENGKGLVLLSGSSGAGMSETMTTLLEAASQFEGRHILAVDDVFETAPPTGPALVIRRQIGDHADTWANALRTGLREDPDVIFVGDLSEPAAFEMALRAAEGGRLVIGGIHSPSVVGAVRRLLSFYPEYDVPRIRTTLSSVLTAVLCHKLVPDRDHLSLLPATELLWVDEAAREILREGSFSNLRLLMRMPETPGHTFDSCLKVMLDEQKVWFEDAFSRADDKTWFLQTVQTEKS